MVTMKKYISFLFAALFYWGLLVPILELIT